MTQVHHEWLAKWQREVQEEYDRLHAVAKKEIQLSGHGGEATWIRLLEEWLPPAYEVTGRKYIVPEVGDDKFETDVVIFNPGYPERLRAREDVLAGGVAAAFSVKLTLDAAGLRDAADRAARLRRAMKTRNGSPRSEMTGPFAFGVLAHSHGWKQPKSTPRENLSRNLWELDGTTALHPRESLDFVCIADLASVHTMRMPYMPPQYLSHLGGTGIDFSNGLAISAMTVSDENEPAGPVATFIASLIIRLSQTDPTLIPFADGLRLTETLGSGSGPQRFHALSDVFTDDVIAALPTRAFSEGDWSSALY